MPKILIVDDAPTVLNIEEYILTQEKFQVDKADNAMAALDKIRNQQYDLGIFDVNMPGKSGIELTEEARQLPYGKNMKILILTTVTDSEMRDRAKKAGANGWILEPFEEEDLVKAVKQILGVS